MSSASSVSAPARPVADVLGACSACPHPLAAHDAISLRFCRATEDQLVDAAATRGCVCPSA
jgi:hypothetical protein